MSKKGKKKKIINIANRHLGMAAIALIVSVLFVFMTVESNELKERIATLEVRAETLREKIEGEEERTLAIDELQKYMLTDEYAEEVGREQLGLVKENEIVFEEAE